MTSPTFRLIDAELSWVCLNYDARFLRDSVRFFSARASSADAYASRAVAIAASLCCICMTCARSYVSSWRTLLVRFFTRFPNMANLLSFVVYSYLILNISLKNITGAPRNACAALTNDVSSASTALICAPCFSNSAANLVGA